MPPKDKKETSKTTAESKLGVVEHKSGKFIFANGDSYEGEYIILGGSSGVERSGRGILTRATDGAVYAGTWHQDRLNGAHGVYEHPASGCRYEGEFRDGLFHGRGVYTWPDGAVYEGEFDSGRMRGQGTFKDPNGQIWIGQFRFDSGDSIARLKFRLNM